MDDVIGMWGVCMIYDVAGEMAGKKIQNESTLSTTPRALTCTTADRYVGIRIKTVCT